MSANLNREFDSIETHRKVLRDNYKNMILISLGCTFLIPMIYEIWKLGFKETSTFIGINIVVAEFVRRNIDNSFTRTMKASLILSHELFKSSMLNRGLQVLLLGGSSYLLLESFKITNSLLPRIVLTSVAIFLNISLSMKVNKKHVM